MADPASVSGSQAGRRRIAPERILAWLSVVGLAYYGALWLIHQSFYRAFGLSVSMVGVGQAEMVTSAAVFALWVGPLLAYPAVIVRFLFSRARGRGALLEAIFGAVLLIGMLLLLQLAPLEDAMRDIDGSSPSGLGILAMFLAMVALLSFVLFVKGLGDLSAAFLFYRGIRPAYKWWLVRRYLGRPRTTEAVFTTYVRARRAARRRAASRRAAWRRDLRAVGRTYRFALVAVLGLGFFLAVALLADMAERDAQARIADRKYETNWVYHIFTPGEVARPVELIAHQQRLRPLEKAKMLYLGTHDGTEVLYDRSAKRAVLVPAGSVTLILRPQ